MTTVFILDDVRTIKEAIDGANLAINVECTAALVRNIRDAVDVVAYSKRFDFWILDNDLGPNEEGITFLKMCIETCPDKIPNYVRSCSSNPPRRKAIVDLFNDWISGGRRSMLPIGAS